MRISTDPDDRGYATWESLGKNVSVWLNGVKQGLGCAADDELGFVEVDDTDERGKIVIENGKPRTRILHGSVRIEAERKA